MVLNVFMPLIEALIEKIILSIERCFDRGCCPKDKYVTKKKSIAQYIQLYAGIDHMIHYGYSTLLVIIFVTFMFGFGIPILFPIAGLTLFMLYRVEKYMLYYFYKQPPMYDAKITKEILTTMRLAPFLYMCCGYWMLTNQQLLSNDHLHPMYDKDDEPQTDHDIGMIFSAEGWKWMYWPVGFMAIMAGFYYWAANWMQKNWLERASRHFRIGASLEILEEGLDNYWSALSKADRRWSQREEYYQRVALGMPMFTDDQIQALRSKDGKKRKSQASRLYNSHTYDILANRTYAERFHYISAALGEDRAKYIVDSDSEEGNDAAQSDLCRICLNLAFLPEDEGRAFQYDK